MGPTPFLTRLSACEQIVPRTICSDTRFRPRPSAYAETVSQTVSADARFRPWSKSYTNIQIKRPP